MQISPLCAYQEQKPRKAEKQNIPRYKSQFKVWNESCCQLMETDRVGLCNPQYYRLLHRSKIHGPKKLHQKRKVPPNSGFRKTYNQACLQIHLHSCCQEEFRSWTAAHPQLYIPFISLLPLRWGKNCQHAILTQPVLTNLIRTSLIRPCCLAVLGQLHRSCSLLQSLFQNKIVVLQPLLHKVAYETLSRCTENTPHCQC